MSITNRLWKVYFLVFSFHFTLFLISFLGGKQWLVAHILIWQLTQIGDCDMEGEKATKKTMGEMGFKCDRRPLHSIMDLKTWSFYFWLKIPSLSAPSPQAVDWWLHLSNMTSKHPRLAAGSKLENDRLEHKEVESQLVEFIALQYSAEDKGPKLRSTSTWSFWGQTKMKLGIKGKHHPLPFYKLHW